MKANQKMKTHNASFIGLASENVMHKAESFDVFSSIYQASSEMRHADGIKLILDKNLKGLKRSLKFNSNHAWYCLGDLYFKRGLYRLAKKAFRRSIRYNHRDFFAHMGLANCYSELGCHRMAERVLRHSLSLNPSTDVADDIWYNLGCCMWDVGRFDEARWVFKKLIQSPHEAGRHARSNLEKLGEQPPLPFPN
jgi:tetratricopeptide (TPR) repeat protein